MENGPEFLYLPKEEWPVENAKPDAKEVERECRSSKLVGAVTTSVNVIDSERFSSWRKLVRVTAWVLRAKSTLLAKVRSTAKDTARGDCLTPAELERSRTFWIKRAQTKIRAQLKSNELRSLSPFTDEEGTVRVGGRIDNSLVSYETKHPALLPYNHRISKLIVEEFHKRGHHGVATTVAKIRRMYWIIRAHDLAKSIKAKCVTCRAANPKTESQIMANLPPQRLQPHSPPFHYTACDYFGPLTVKVGRNKRTKHYGVIFTCLNTRAVHLEIATDCSAMEFIQTLRRFFSIRGYPAEILSDNGTQFVGALTDLRKMIQGADKRLLQDYCAEKEYNGSLAPQRHHIKTDVQRRW
ncbi:uncharacterized protein LOC124437283 [Xenia sp. Carnegie-2017]|uniref:uncharacterized protein LOC124437283 n=1 Tax=Xenia sp. Carnegie-2017 TaxID=2897299 RepID=UPI001F03A5F4|nr:uncharacterized protein LOC124437283 [Xenia sp. Carnegie-2017]